MSKDNSAPKKGKKMAIRVIVGVLLALFAIFLLTLAGYGHYQYIFIVMSLFCGLCLHEIMTVAGCKNQVLIWISVIVAGFIPVYNAFELGRFVPFGTTILVAIYVIAMLIIMLKMFSVTKFVHVAVAIFSSIAIPQATSCLFFTFRFMEEQDIFCRSNNIFVLLIAMFCAWLSDAFALFSGMALGKHKMAPNISPKKTIEGAIGGIVGTTLSSLIAWAVCNHFYFSTDTIKWWMVVVFVPVICIMGMCGDLSASVIKRNYGVKDFGSLFPEHGGVMDRIDSFLFTMPATYLIVKIAVTLFA